MNGLLWLHRLWLFALIALLVSMAWKNPSTPGLGKQNERLELGRKSGGALW